MRKRKSEKGENDRAYSAMDPFEPVINTTAEMGSTGSGSMQERNGSKDRSDLMQHMFKEFSMWYSKQHMSGTTLNSSKFNFFRPYNLR
jgi:hypothetical protein